MNSDKGRSKDYVMCWNCNGRVQKKLLKPDRYDGTCPLCEAEGLNED